MEKYFSFKAFIQFLIKVTNSAARLLELLFIELEMNFFKHHKKIIVGGNFFTLKTPSANNETLSF